MRLSTARVASSTNRPLFALPANYANSKNLSVKQDEQPFRSNHQPPIGGIMVLDASDPTDRDIIELIIHHPLDERTRFVILEHDSYTEKDENMEPIWIWF